MCVQLSLKLIELLVIDFFSYNRLLIVGLECGLNVFRLVTKVQDKRVILPWTRSIKPAESLYGLNSSKLLVNVHGVEQRLIKASLVFLGNDQNAVLREY